MGTLNALLAAAMILNGGVPFVAPSLPPTARESLKPVASAEQVIEVERKQTSDVSSLSPPTPASAPQQEPTQVLPPRLLDPHGPLWSEGVMIDPDLRTWSGEGSEDGLGLL